MTDLIRIKKKLEKFGLSDNQAEIYIFLLRQGTMRISELSSSLRIPRSSVYEALKGLFSLGLAEEIIENNFKVIKAYPISVLRHKFDEQANELQQQTKSVEQLEKVLEVLPGIKPRSPIVIRYYKDRAGARQLYWNTLRARNTIYVMSEWGRGRYVGIEFYKKFVVESYARGFSEQVLINPTSRILDSIKQHMHSPVSRTELDNIRGIDEQIINFRGDTLMYDNIYAHIDLKNDQISGFEIESKQFASMQRAIFETLWKEAKPVSKLL
jgi:sugar-specific transcriptional regulator TrmB